MDKPGLPLGLFRLKHDACKAQSRLDQFYSGFRKTDLQARFFVSVGPWNRAAVLAVNVLRIVVYTLYKLKNMLHKQN